jgi:hypothetical protein
MTQAPGTLYSDSIVVDVCAAVAPFVTSGGTTIYDFHAANGDLLVEYTPSQTNRLVESIYLDGKRITQRTSDQSAPTSITPTATTLTADVAGAVILGVTIGGASPTGTVVFAKQSTALRTAFVAA